jgi:hypothetical protein
MAYFYSTDKFGRFMKKFYLLPLILATTLFSCDVIDDPFGGATPIDPIDTTTVKRKILIEEFTGHRCNNCPSAATEIKTLQASGFGDQIIAVAIHAGPSNFTGTNPNYPTDFTTPEGEEWATYFGLFGLPIGMVSRAQYSSTTTLHLKRYEDWGGLANDLRSLPAEIKITLAASLSADSTSTTADVQISTLEELDNNHKLVVLLMENNIVSPQTMPDYTRNTSYNHMFVFRKTFNTAWGEPVFEAGVGTGETFTKQLSLPMDTNWVPANCQIIAYVYDEVTQEVKQAEIVDLIP